MNKPSITIGISVYDRINEAKVSAMLARSVLAEHFNVYIVIAACKPETVADLLVEPFIDTVLVPDVKNTVNYNFNVHSNLGAARTFSSFLKCGAHAQNNNSDFYCFGNAGSWLLSPQGILEITSNLNKQKKLVACRVSKKDRKYTVEDHFFLINLKLSKDVTFFEEKFFNRLFNPIFFYDNGIHSLLENWINMKTEPGQVMIYSDLTDCRNIYGDTVKSFVPFTIDPNRSFLHSNPNNWEDEIIALRIKYINNCCWINDEQKKIMIDLLKKETIGVIRNFKIAEDSFYCLDINTKKGLIYKLVRSRLTWKVLQMTSHIIQYGGLKFPYFNKIGKKMQNFLNKYSDGFEKIDVEKIQ